MSKTVGILILVLAISLMTGGVVLLIPQEPPIAEPINVVPPPQSLDVEIFTSPEYETIDRRLIETGQLPVTPPGNIGKNNPFQ